MRDKCHFCGGPMVWDSDATIEDVTGEPVPGIVSSLHCLECGATAEWMKKEAEE